MQVVVEHEQANILCGKPVLFDKFDCADRFSRYFGM